MRHLICQPAQNGHGLPLNVPPINQPQKGFVDQRRGLQDVALRHLPSSVWPDDAIRRTRCKLFERRRIAVVPGDEVEVIPGLRGLQ